MRIVLYVGRFLIFKFHVSNRHCASQLFCVFLWQFGKICHSEIYPFYLSQLIDSHEDVYSISLLLMRAFTFIPDIDNFCFLPFILD